jgi:flagellar biosynthesis anti-sigma factor FlgM
MDVRGVGSSLGAVPVRSGAGVSPNRELTGTKPVSPKDELEISAAGKMLEQASQNPDIRQERIAAIKAAIENGTYDTDAKLEAALSKMFDALGLDFDSESR